MILQAKKLSILLRDGLKNIRKDRGGKHKNWGSFKNLFDSSFLFPPHFYDFFLFQILFLATQQHKKRDGLVFRVIHVWMLGVTRGGNQRVAEKKKMAEKRFCSLRLLSQIQALIYNCFYSLLQKKEETSRIQYPKL